MADEQPEKSEATKDYIEAHRATEAKREELYELRRTQEEARRELVAAETSRCALAARAALDPDLKDQMAASADAVRRCEMKFDELTEAVHVAEREHAVLLEAERQASAPWAEEEKARLLRCAESLIQSFGDLVRLKVQKEPSGLPASLPPKSSRLYDALRAHSATSRSRATRHHPFLRRRTCSQLPAVREALDARHALLPLPVHR